MAPVATALSAKAAALYASHPPSPPTCCWISTVTGGVLSTAEAATPDYWARQTLEPVDFVSAFQTAMHEYSQREVSGYETSRTLYLVELGEGMLERFVRHILREESDDNSKTRRCDPRVAVRMPICPCMPTRPHMPTQMRPGWQI